METYPRWRRRQTLVDPEHQLRFTSVLLVQMTAVMLATSGFAWLESRRTMQLVLQHLTDFPTTSHALHLNNQAFLVKIILTIAVTGVIQVLFGIYQSHKLAGPVHQMSGILDRASRGDFAGRVKFREGDQLDSLGQVLNSMLEKLDHSKGSSRAEVEAIEQTLSCWSEAGAKPPSEPEVEALRAQIHRMCGAAAPVEAAAVR